MVQVRYIRFLTSLLGSILGSSIRATRIAVYNSFSAFGTKEHDYEPLEVYLVRSCFPAMLRLPIWPKGQNCTARSIQASRPLLSLTPPSFAPSPWYIKPGS
ncbi:hypothetical protein ABKN59_002363 [Abortiporus biennis]